jgi:NAD(P)H-hydrate epimerase
MPEHELPPLPPRPPNTHKGAMGRVLLVAGARGMAGAAALAAEAALRGGAGYAVICCPGSITPDLSAAVPSAILAPCGDATRAALAPEDLPLMIEQARRAQALVVGPGLGSACGAEQWLPELLRERGNIGAVVDADGLNALARNGAWEQADAAVILTPHPGEAARLLGWSEGAARVQADRPAALAALTARTAATVLLKGSGTLVGARGAAAWKNASGNPGLATAGSGDVLSGLIGALLARGMTIPDAARLGAWLHGRAADLLTMRIGEDTLIASDLALAFGAAFLEHQRLTSSHKHAC